MKHRALSAALAVLVAACGETTGPTAPSTAGFGFEDSSSVVTVNGVRLLRSPGVPSSHLTLRTKKKVGQGSSSQTSTSFDRHLINGTGGSVHVDGASLYVPRGALDETVHVTMEKGETREDGLWSYEFGPHGLTFDKSATLTIEVRQSDLEALGIDPSRLSVAYVSHPDHADWQILGGEYDAEAETISVPIDHFSRYALCIE